MSLLVALATQAQHISQDYLVTTAGDTLRGRIKLAGKSAQNIQLHRPNQAPAMFTAEAVRSYGSSNSLLKASVQVGPHGGRRFLVPLVKGYVNLYAGKNEAADVRYYLQPTDSAYAVEVVPELALLTYARLLPGCPELEIGTTNFQLRYPYTTNGLTRLVTDYSKCRQQPTALLKTPSGIRATYGLKVGANISSFNLATDSYGEQVYATNHTQATGYEVGLMLLLTTRSNFALQLEGNYLQLSSNYGPAPPANYNSGIYTGTYAVRVRYSQLQLPILLRYNFSQGPIAPYFNLGPVVGTSFNNKSIRVVSNTTGTATTDEPYSANIASLTLGGAGSAGLALRATNSLSLFAETRYDYMVDNFANSVHHSSLHFDIGVVF